MKSDNFPADIEIQASKELTKEQLASKARKILQDDLERLQFELDIKYKHEFSKRKDPSKIRIEKERS